MGFFILAVVQFYMPGTGFTCLIFFGGKPEMRRIKELKTVNYYVEEDSYGYDAQYYAQIAIKPLLLSRDLLAAMDNLPYRARRILFCWTAYVLGLGRPAATEFSFLVGIPTMLAAGALKIFKALHHPDPLAPHENWGLVLLATVIAAVVSFIAVKWLLRYIQTHTFNVFGWYRVVLAIAIFVLMRR